MSTNLAASCISGAARRLCLPEVMLAWTVLGLTAIVDGRMAPMKPALVSESFLLNAFDSLNAGNTIFELRGDLPPGWSRFQDPLTKEPYFYNNVTGVTTWEEPQSNSIELLPVCTANMIKSAYTRCDPVASTRSLAFFHSVPCKEGDPLPPTIVGLPCNTSCDPGHFLPLGKPACVPCKPGTYSVGGGLLFTNWEHLPVGMSSFCRFQLEADRSQPCTAWILNGTFIESGRMRGKRLVDSTLEYKIEIIRPGSVTFEFRVDAERRWDGLYFAVDGEKVMDMVSYQFQYTSYTKQLDVGFHTLQWVYHKDVAYEMGEDKAWIRSIEVTGTQASVDFCNICPAGRYSETGAALCSMCPTNTFSEKSGSGVCEPCNGPGGLDRPHMYSYPGATVCLPSVACVPEDITAVFGECNDATGMRTKTYSYKQPQICFGGAEPPPPEETTCALCDPGMYRDGNECKYCPTGTCNPNATVEGISVCNSCPSGSIALKVQYFHKAFEPDHFNQLIASGEVSTGCANGFCGQNGWRPLGDKIDTGVGNGQVADIWVSLQVVMETDGEVSFKFSRRSINSENMLQMYIDDSRLWGIETLQAMAENDEQLTFRADVPEGQHVITWVFHKEREYSWMEDEEEEDAAAITPTSGAEDRAIIEEILVTGVAVGGAVQCTRCSPGQYSDVKTSTCLPCRPGSFTKSTGMPSCTPCPAGFFASTPGSTVCLRCGHGTYSDSGADSCNVSPSQCRYTISDDLTYDLGGLARVGGPMWGPVNDPNNSMSYFINVCTKDRSNTTCTGRDGNGFQAFACQEAMIADEFHENYLAVSLGDVMGFYTLEDAPRNGLVVSFEGGTPCMNGQKRSLNITMICDRTVGPGEPVIFPGSAVEYAKCQYHLLWRSQYACPLCTEADMVAIPGECAITGTRPVNMAWNEPKRCYGGMQLPPIRSEECVAVVLDKTKVAAIVLASAALFLMLCFALIFLYLRNRKIYREYSVLKEQNEADMELERYTLDEEDA